MTAFLKLPGSVPVQIGNAFRSLGGSALPQMRWSSEARRFYGFTGEQRPLVRQRFSLGCDATVGDPVRRARLDFDPECVCPLALERFGLEE